MSKEHDNRPTPASNADDRSQLEALVTVETQREFDLFTGQRSDRTFLKMYVEARTSGLLAAISDRDWKTLCALATYMDADGYCFPSQAELARALGCSRQMANERVKSLAAFRFEGKAVLLIEKVERSERGTWARNGYRILPISSLSIFDSEAGEPHTTTHGPAKAPDTTVSRELDTVPPADATVSSQTGTVPLDTNKNQSINKIHPSNIRKAAPSKSAMEEVGAILKRRTPQAQSTPAYDEDRQVILAFIQDFARELGDNAPLKSSTTRAYRLFKRSGLAREQFIEAMFQARALTKERSAAIRGTGDQPRGFGPKNRIAYWFACLESLAEGSSHERGLDQS